MKLFLQAICLSLVMEGLAFALFPSFCRMAMTEMLRQPDSALRRLGALCLGFAILLALALALLA